jgi:hypothetical protein
MQAGLQELQLLFEFPEGLTVLFIQAKQLPLLKYVLAVHVAQGPVEMQVTQSNGHTIHEALELLVGLT